MATAIELNHPQTQGDFAGSSLPYIVPNATPISENLADILDMRKF
jgi:hypothetical protein